jgi:hypothetical protein
MTSPKDAVEFLKSLGLDPDMLMDEASLLKLISLRKSESIDNVFEVVLKENVANLGRADLFFLTFILSKADKTDVSNFSGLISVVEKLSNILTSVPNNIELGSFQAIDTIIEIYKKLQSNDPFFYTKDISKKLEEVFLNYAFTLNNNEKEKVFVRCVKNNVIDLTDNILDFDMMNKDSDCCRLFFNYLLKEMPAHYYVSKSNLVINVARKIVTINDVSEIPIDERNMKLSIHDYVLRISSQSHDPAKACVHLFSERSFTSMFDSLNDEYSFDKEDSHQQLLY